MMMTNYQFITESDIDTVAEIITTLLIQTLEQTGIYGFTNELILKEKKIVKNWLKQEIVAGKYLN